MHGPLHCSHALHCKSPDHVPFTSGVAQRQNHSLLVQSLLRSGDESKSRTAAMTATDCFWTILMLSGLSVCLARSLNNPRNRSLRRHCYLLAARFFDLVRTIAGTKAFVITIFFYLVARDALSLLYRIIKAAISRYTAPYPSPLAAKVAFREVNSINAQLRTWIEEDAEAAWRQKQEARDECLRLARERRMRFRVECCESAASEM